MKNKISSLTGLTLLLYVFISFTDRQLLRVPVTIGDFFIQVDLRLFDVGILLIFLLILLGFYDILRMESDYTADDAWVHLVLPAGAAVVIGVSLRNASGGIAWWLLLLAGGAMLYLLLLSESEICAGNYAVKPGAEVLITALSYGFFGLGMIGIRSNVSRLVFIIPLVYLLTWVMTFRIFLIFLYYEELSIHVSAASFISACAAAALHYCPLNAVSYGVIMFLWYYVFTRGEILITEGFTPKEALTRQIPAALLLTALFIYFQFGRITRL